MVDPVSQAPEVVPAEAVESQAAQSPAGDALPWVLGGGALVLLGIGGAAFARRRRADPVLDDSVRRYATTNATVAPAAPLTTTPVMANKPVAPSPAPAPRAETRPAYSAPAMAHGTDEDAVLAAMVAQAPDDANPFLTHAKRLRRARVLLAEQGNGGTAPVTSSSMASDQAPLIAPAPAQDRAQTVYRFGDTRPRSGGLKPSRS